MIKQGKIATYVKEKEIYKNAPYRIRNGNAFYIVDDKEIPKKEWESMNPAPELIITNDENPDKTHVR